MAGEMRKTWVSIALLFASVQSGLCYTAGPCDDPVKCKADPSCTAGNYVDCTDREVMGWAGQASDQFCITEDLQGDVDAEAAKESLESALGGDNFLLDALRDSKDTDEAMDEMWANLEAGIAVFFAPVVIAFITLFCGLICCWSGCPCCRCCRCGAKERETPKLVRALSLIFPLLLFIGILAGMAVAAAGFGAMESGAANAACTSAKMLYTTLAGKTTAPTFIGMSPVLRQFYDMSQLLVDGSAFTNELSKITTETFDVAKSVDLASETLALLADMMNLPQNQNPKQPKNSGSDLLHDCQFCKELAGPVSKASTEVKTSIGAALKDARKEVDSQLTGSKRADLTKTLSDGTKPMIEFKEKMRDFLKPFVKPGEYEKIKADIEAGGIAFVMLAFLFAFFICCCGTVGAGTFVLKGEKGADGQYSKWPHRCACPAWLCGLGFVIWVMTLGGIVVGLTVPVSAICLVADDLDRQMLNDIAPALEIDLQSPEGEMLADLLGACINPVDKSSNPNLLDLIFETNATTNKKVTMRDRIVTQVRDPIDEKFATIENRTKAVGGATLSGAAAMVNLMNLLDLNPFAALMMTEGTTMSADATYQAMGTQSDVATAFGTSASCAGVTLNLTGMDASVTAKIPSVVPGMDQWYAKFTAQNYGQVTLTQVTPCNVYDFDCTAVASANQAICTAAKAYVALFKKVIDPNNKYMRCDLWEKPGQPSQFCDVKDMVETAPGSGKYTNDCINQQTGLAKRKERWCNLQEFADYFKQYKTRIFRTTKRVDDTALAIGPKITTNLKSLVDRDILKPITQILDGITCGWLPPNWQEMIDGLCYQGVWGLRRVGQGWVIVSCFMIIYIIGIYAVWRRHIDNVNAVSDGAAPAAPAASAEVSM